MDERLAACWLRVVVVGLLLLVCPSAAKVLGNDTSRNVLFIVSDDLNSDVGCYGSPRAVTPHLDRLAAMGMRFQRAYCQYTACNPSRNSFLSGMRPAETGLPAKWTALRSLVPEVTTLPQLFRENGYYTASIGKVFHIDGWDKRWPDAGWEKGDAPTRVPLMIRVPDMTSPGSVSDQLVELVDLFPTLQELCELPAPNQKLAGRSLVPLLKDPSVSWEPRPAFTQIRRSTDTLGSVMGYSVRTENHRYNEWWTETQPPQLLASELYDLQWDPAEEVNQADNPAYRAAREELSLQLQSCRAQSR